jgi:hypothetical protein
LVFGSFRVTIVKKKEEVTEAERRLGFSGAVFGFSGVPRD